MQIQSERRVHSKNLIQWYSYAREVTSSSVQQCLYFQRIDVQSLLSFSTGRHQRVLLPTACCSYSMIRAHQITYLIQLVQKVSSDQA